MGPKPGGSDDELLALLYGGGGVLRIHVADVCVSIEHGLPCLAIDKYNTCLFMSLQMHVSIYIYNHLDNIESAKGTPGHF